MYSVKKYGYGCSFFTLNQERQGASASITLCADERTVRKQYTRTVETTGQFCFSNPFVVRRGLLEILKYIR